MAKNVFAEYVDKLYKYRYAGEIYIEELMGGTPSNPKVAEGWLKAKLGIKTEDVIAEAVKEVMAARAVSVEGPISEDEALKLVDDQRHLNGFMRDEDGLYIKGRHLKAAIKEAASAARAVGNLPAKFGATNKGTLSFIAEHIVVVENDLHVYREDPETKKIVNVLECTDIVQSFPRNPITRQTGIQYTERIMNAIVSFTVVSDYHFKLEEWAAIWVTGSNQGIGASRSQGYGRYTPTRWDRLPVKS